MSLWPSTDLPKSVQEIYLICFKQLSVQVDNLFEYIDDTLFELADKATSNIEKIEYFDSMYEMRIKREDINNIFHDHIHEAFKLIATNSNADINESIINELSSSQNKAIKYGVNISAMITKTDTKYAEPLNNLICKLKSLKLGLEPNIYTNPVGGNILCEAFSDACSELELNNDIRLILYNLFEKHVLLCLDNLYAEVHKQSMETKPIQRANTIENYALTSELSSKNKDTLDKYNHDNNHDEVFDMLRELLVIKQGIGSAETSSNPTKQTKLILTQDDLLLILAQLQAEKKEDIKQIQLGAAVDKNLLDLTAMINQKLSPLKTKTINGNDKEIINLVSMLFEFILEDSTLSAPMNVLLDCLQIPILKIALIDHNFFSQNDHPARKLLNKLAIAAMGCSGVTNSEKDPLFQKIIEVTATIINEFDADQKVFQSLLNDFTAFTEIEANRVVVIEQRTNEVEESLGNVQIAQAKISDIINSRTAGQKLPQVVLQIIQDGWSNYLFYLLVKSTKPSGEWSKAINTLDALIWSVQPKSNSKERQQLLNKIPELLNNLYIGLDAMSFKMSRLQGVFNSLELVHKGVLHPAGVYDDIHNIKRAVINKDIIVNPIQLDQPMVAFDKEYYFELVDKMRTGAWVEFAHDNAANSRAKLAAIIKSTGKYIFVNRVGMKVAEKSRLSLATDLWKKKILVLEGGLLFDSALELVINQLRKDN